MKERGDVYNGDVTLQRSQRRERRQNGTRGKGRLVKRLVRGDEQRIKDTPMHEWHGECFWRGLEQFMPKFPKC